MARKALVIGYSGSGKSTSMRKLNPKETFIINCEDKDLPFKGWRSYYTPFTSETPEGNILNSDDSEVIKKALQYISAKRPEIKYVVIDDFQYTFCNEYMRRAKESGFGKFTDIGQKAWSLVNVIKSLRSDLTVFFFEHPEIDLDAAGNKFLKAKTIGKMLDNVMTLEGMFTVVLFTKVESEAGGMKHSFVTQSDGTTTGKSPDGMFSSLLIPNDLTLVIEAMDAYEVE